MHVRVYFFHAVAMDFVGPFKDQAVLIVSADYEYAYEIVVVRFQRRPKIHELDGIELVVDYGFESLRVDVRGERKFSGYREEDLVMPRFVVRTGNDAEQFIHLSLSVNSAYRFLIRREEFVLLVDYRRHDRFGK